MPKKMSWGSIEWNTTPISSNSYFSLEFICTSIANLVLFINLGTTQYNKLDQEYLTGSSRVSVLIEKKLHLFHLAQNVTMIFQVTTHFSSCLKNSFVSIVYYLKNFQTIRLYLKIPDDKRITFLFGIEFRRLDYIIA